ncbi:MAG: hypothetical protein K2H80_01645, partial [Ureaplasma sp.]|nr:hypothetical protein [Ureaplasma sp.]
PNGVVYFRYNTTSNTQPTLTNEQTTENTVIRKIVMKTFSNCNNSLLEWRQKSNNSIVVGWPTGDNIVVKP